MSEINTGGPAFPTTTKLNYEPATGAQWSEHIDPGMTLRQYAAIKLRVPYSGDTWLDVMIEQSLRDELAAKAMQGVISSLQEGEDFTDRGCEWAYNVADAMLKARNA